MKARVNLRAIRNRKPLERPLCAATTRRTSPVVPVPRVRAALRLGGAASADTAAGEHRLQLSSRGTRLGDRNTSRLQAAQSDLVAPQMSDIEEEVIIEKEEDGKVNSHIIFRIGGLVDVFEVEDLTEKVGWPRRLPQKVKTALENSFMVTTLLLQTMNPEDGSVEGEKLIGIIRVTSDTVFNATLWDVTVDPEYQGEGLGKTLMEMTIRKLLRLDIRTISLFAEPQVIDFYRKLGFWRDPQGIRAMFWYPRW